MDKPAPPLASALVAAVLLLGTSAARADIALVSVAFSCEGDNLVFGRTCSQSEYGSMSSCPQTKAGDAVTACGAGDTAGVPLGSVSSYTSTGHACQAYDGGGSPKCFYYGEGTVDTPCSALHGYAKLCLAPSDCRASDGCGDVPSNLPPPAGADGSDGCSVRSVRGGVAAGFAAVLGLALVMLGRLRGNPRR